MVKSHENESICNYYYIRVIREPAVCCTIMGEQPEAIACYLASIALIGTSYNNIPGMLA